LVPTADRDAPRGIFRWQQLLGTPYIPSAFSAKALFPIPQPVFSVAARCFSGQMLSFIGAAQYAQLPALRNPFT
jgi:hypothetical protein